MGMVGERRDREKQLELFTQPTTDADANANTNTVAYLKAHGTPSN